MPVQPRWRLYQWGDQLSNLLFVSKGHQDEFYYPVTLLILLNGSLLIQRLYILLRLPSHLLDFGAVLLHDVCGVLGDFFELVQKALNTLLCCCNVSPGPPAASSPPQAWPSLLPAGLPRSRLPYLDQSRKKVDRSRQARMSENSRVLLYSKEEG